MKKLLCALMALMLMAAGTALAQDTVEYDETLSYRLDEDAFLLTVELVENATTGFLWSAVLSRENVLREVPGDVEADGDAAEGDGEALAGAPTVRRFLFESAMDEAGLVTVSFVYARPWEEAAEGAYDMDVWVDEAGLVSVYAVRQAPLAWNAGDSVLCPECMAAMAEVGEVVIGGDEETGAAWFLTAECPDCGTVELMEAFDEGDGADR